MIRFSNAMSASSTAAAPPTPAPRSSKPSAAPNSGRCAGRRAGRQTGQIRHSPARQCPALLPARTDHGGGPGLTAKLAPPPGCALAGQSQSRGRSSPGDLRRSGEMGRTRGCAAAQRLSKLSDGTLVAPDKTGFPDLPNSPFKPSLINPVLDYDFGPGLRNPDESRNHGHPAAQGAGCPSHPRRQGRCRWQRI